MLDNDVALIVDDSTTARKVIANILRDYLNCRQILQAANGNEALSILRKKNQAVDWIFCDWEMPSMSGDQLLAEVRKEPTTAHTPFIMITTRGDRDSLVSAVQAGASSYIVKPFNAAILVNKIRTILGRMERRKAERIKVLEGIQAILTIDNEKPEPTALLDISLTGLLLRVPHQFTHNVGIYDNGTVQLTIDHEKGSPLVLPGTVVRIEADPAHPARTDQVRLALRFSPMDQKARTDLVLFTEGLRNRTLVIDSSDELPG